MKKIYKNQSKLRIILNTGCDLSGWNTLEIRFRKPDGETGFFNADILDEKKGIIFHDVQNRNELDQKGEWKIWSYVLFDDDRNAFGVPQKMCVYPEGF